MSGPETPAEKSWSLLHGIQTDLTSILDELKRSSSNSIQSKGMLKLSLRYVIKTIQEIKDILYPMEEENSRLFELANSVSDYLSLRRNCIVNQGAVGGLEQAEVDKIDDMLALIKSIKNMKEKKNDLSIDIN